MTIQNRAIVSVATVITAVAVALGSIIMGFILSDVIDIHVALRVAFAVISFLTLLMVTYMVFRNFVKGKVEEIEYVSTIRASVIEQSTTEITRQEIMDRARAMNDTNITVCEKQNDPRCPYTLKWQKKTFIMMYGTDKGVILIARISDEYASQLGNFHNVTRAKFPRGDNWYVIPVDSTFTTKESVYKIIDTACDFVKAKISAAQNKAA